MDTSDVTIFSALQKELNIYATSSNPREKGDALLFLLHLLGDLMQPLHVTALVSENTPKGDSGGLKYTLRGVRQKNLHFFTDSVAGLIDEVWLSLFIDCRWTVHMISMKCVYRKTFTDHRMKICCRKTLFFCGLENRMLEVKQSMT